MVSFVAADIDRWKILRVICAGLFRDFCIISCQFLIIFTSNYMFSYTRYGVCTLPVDLSLDIIHENT